MSLVVKLTYLFKYSIQQSVNHVTNSRCSLRLAATSQRRRNNSVSMTDRGEAAVGGERTSGLENIVAEEHRPGFKLRVRFVAADSPRREPTGGHPSTSMNSSGGSTTARTTTTSVDARAAIQYHLTDRGDDAT